MSSKTLLLLLPILCLLPGAPCCPPQVTQSLVAHTLPLTWCFTPTTNIVALKFWARRCCRTSVVHAFTFKTPCPEKWGKVPLLRHSQSFTPTAENLSAMSLGKSFQGGLLKSKKCVCACVLVRVCRDLSRHLQIYYESDFTQFVIS